MQWSREREAALRKAEDAQTDESRTYWLAIARTLRDCMNDLVREFALDVPGDPSDEEQAVSS
jgi:hypothetical protein